MSLQYLAKEAFLSFEIIQRAKIKDEEFGTGTIVRVACPKDLYLNLQNPNSTAKCSRGRWKPMKPACMNERCEYWDTFRLGPNNNQLPLPDKKPCTVPSLENGKYHGTVVDAADHNRFNVAFQDFDTVQSGELLMVTCDTGYIVNVRVAAW